MKGTYKLAINDYETAYKMYKKQDLNFNNRYIGFFIQQSVEKLLHYEIEMTGKIYPRCESIIELIDKAKELNIEIPQEIIEYDYMLDKWKANALYCYNFHVSTRKIELLLEVIKAWIDRIKLNEQEIEVQYSAKNILIYN